MTRLEKSEIIEKIKGMSSAEIQELYSCINSNNVYSTHRITTYKRGKFSRHIKESGYFLNKILNLPIENDAPRGGQDGNFITIKEIKTNKEKIKFTKEFLEIF